MKKEIKEKYPSWVREREGYSLCLTDDLDSLVSCALLKEINNQTISRFFDFETLYKIKGKEEKENLIGVDMDLVNGRCWGNHVVKINKDIDLPKSANINNINNISMQNYTSKFCCSTLLQIISYYNYNISKLSTLAKQLLLCIDSTYLSYNFNKKICYKYLVEQLELEELYSILETYSTYDFTKLKNKLDINQKIFVRYDNKIHTRLDLNVLSSILQLDLTFIQDMEVSTDSKIEYSNNVMKNIWTPSNYSAEDIKGVFSMAITNKNTIKYSKQI